LRHATVVKGCDPATKRVKNLEPNHPDLATAYNNLADACLQAGNYKEAGNYFQKALDIKQKNVPKNHPDLAVAYNNLGVAFENTDDYSQALTYYHKALDIKRKIFGDAHPETASTYNNLGSVYTQTGAYNRAIESYRQALAGMEKNSADMLGSVYGNLGAAYRSKGDYNRAISYYQQALQQIRKAYGTDHPNAIFIYNNLGSVFKDKGAYQEAIEYFRRGLDIALKKLNAKHPQLAGLYNNLGVLYTEKGDYARAAEYHQKALDIRIGNSDVSSNTAASYDNLGILYSEQGRYDEALDYHYQALDIRKETLDEDHPDIADTYANLGALYDEKGNYAKAESFYQKALAIELAKLGPRHPDVAATYRSLGSIAAALGNHGQYREYFERALASLGYNGAQSLNAVGSVPVLLDVLQSRANIQRNRYQTEEDIAELYRSRATYRQALPVLDHQFENLPSESRINLAALAYPIYEGALMSNDRLFQLTDSIHYQKEAFTFAERSKAYILYQTMQASDALQFAGIPDSLLEKERQLRIDRTFYAKRRQELLNRGLAETDSSVLAISSALFDSDLRYDSLLRHFENAYPDYYRLKHDLGAVKVEDIQSGLLAEDQTLLEYFVGDSSIYVFTINRDDFRMTRLPGIDSLRPRVTQMRRALIAPHDPSTPEDSPYRNRTHSARKYAKAAGQLYDQLIAPVADRLKPRVVIIPDGVLGYLPFQALLTEKPERAYRYHSHAYFGRQHQLSYAYSATLLREMRNKKHAPGPPKSLLAVAPYYDGSPYKLDSLYRAEMKQLGASPSLAAASRRNPRPLPYSGAEAYSASEIWDGDYLQDERATEQRFTEMAGNYRILHLATHGEANDQIGEYAYLAFTEIPDEQENEFLFIKDIYNLELRAELVILSACQTSAGALQRGEGVMSLARAFTYAGAKSIFTTLWNVDDAAAKDLMIRFHRNLKAGEDKDAALWKAQQQYLENVRGESANPYFWAAFIGLGDMGALR